MRLKTMMLCACCTVLAGITYGQVPTDIPVKVADQLVRNTAARAEVSARLGPQLNSSYARLLQLQQQYPKTFFRGGPSKSLVNEFWYDALEDFSTRIPPEQMYPGVSSLPREHLAEYFLTQQNLELEKWIPILQKQQETLTKEVPFLEQNRRLVTHPAQWDLRWLADQVTPEISYLLVGERHGFTEISNAVTQLVLTLRLRYPQRQIFLFTEFLPEGKTWKELKAFEGTRLHDPTWQAADISQIPVVGLEPRFVWDNIELRLSYQNKQDQACEQLLWGSVEGVRIRNEHWLNTLQQYRQQYPQALFVVYAGGAHLSYLEPYSLGITLPKEQTLVTSLRPQRYYMGHENQPLVTEFDELTEGRFRDRVIHFTSKEAARIAGFDISIQILPLSPGGSPGSVVVGD